jgi:hypothetical protein
MPRLLELPRLLLLLLEDSCWESEDELIQPELPPTSPQAVKSKPQSIKRQTVFI